MSWVLDNYNEQGYLTTCKESAENDDTYATFRKNPFFGLIVENSPLKSGLEYYQCILKQFPWLMEYMEEFIQSDRFGSPKRHQIGDWTVSPSTMRYIKTLGDLVKAFGHPYLDNKRIAEIGPGYGGLCKVIHDIYEPSLYCLYDQAEPLQLQLRFLKEFGVQPMLMPTVLGTPEMDFDLCIAMYSWSELTHPHQVEYMEKVMKRSKNLYIMLNYDMDFSYNLIKESFPAECISDYNLFYDDANMEYYPHNRFIIVKQ